VFINKKSVKRQTSTVMNYRLVTGGLEETEDGHGHANKVGKKKKNILMTTGGETSRREVNKYRIQREKKHLFTIRKLSVLKSRILKKGCQVSEHRTRPKLTRVTGGELKKRRQRGSRKREGHGDQNGSEKGKGENAESENERRRDGTSGSEESAVGNRERGCHTL